MLSPSSCSLNIHDVIPSKFTNKWYIDLMISTANLDRVWGIIPVSVLLMFAMAGCLGEVEIPTSIIEPTKIAVVQAPIPTATPFNQAAVVDLGTPIPPPQPTDTPVPTVTPNPTPTPMMLAPCTHRTLTPLNMAPVDYLYLDPDSVCKLHPPNWYLRNLPPST